MIEDQNLTIAGTVGGEVELRFTPSGAAVVNFSVAVNHRRFNRDSGQWEQTGTDWWRVNAWRQMAENIAESFNKGDRVLVFGKVASREWEDRNGGGKRIAWEITAEEVGHSCKFAPTSQRKAERQQSGQQSDRGQYGGRPSGQAEPPAEDPWATGGGQQTNQPNYGNQGGNQRPHDPQRQHAEDPWGTTPVTTGGGFDGEPPF